MEWLLENALAIAALGTIIIGLLSIISLRRSEMMERKHRFNMSYYEKHHDFIIGNVSEYVKQLDYTEVTIGLLENDKNLGERTRELSGKIRSIEMSLAQLKIGINLKNQHYEELTDALEKSLKICKDIRHADMMIKQTDWHFSCNSKKEHYLKTLIRVSLNNSYEGLGEKEALKKAEERITQNINENHELLFKSSRELEVIKITIIDLTREYLHWAREQIDAPPENLWVRLNPFGRKKG